MHFTRPFEFWQKRLQCFQVVSIDNPVSGVIGRRPSGAVKAYLP